MNKTDPLPITIVLIAFLALALAYGVVIPPFEGLDEIEHFGVVRYVADMGRLPVQGDVSLSAYHVRQEASQPPLYYLVAGPLLRLTRISAVDTSSYLQPNPYVTCGTESIRSNKATLRHDPLAEAFPWRDALLALHVLRAFSTVLQVFTVAGVYAIARRVWPQRPGVATLAASLTAFNPQFLIIASSVNNDNIAAPVITWAVYLCVLVAQQGFSLRRLLTLGVLIGVSALSKLTGLLLLPLAVLAPVPNVKSQIPNFKPANHQVARSANRQIGKLQSSIFNLVILSGVTLSVAGWWYIRNWQLYGDLTGLGPMLEIVGRRGPVPLGLLFSEFGLVFRSYWGQFSCAFFGSELYYSAWAVVVALGLLGLIGGLRRDGATVGRAPYLLVLWFALVFGGWLRWNLTTPAPGGRLLFSAISGTSTLLAFGLASLIPPALSKRLHVIRNAQYAAMPVVGLLALLLWVRPLFAPPPIVDAASIKPHASHPLDARFGESIALLGYDLRAGDLGPGRQLEVTFYWRALRRMSNDYTLALQLAAPAPGDNRTLLNFNTWPGGGNLPTAAWPVGPVIVDHYHLPLPFDTGLTQAWRFQAIWYDARMGDRLPLTLDTQPSGDALTMGLIRVVGARQATTEIPETARLATPVTFDQVIALTHAQVTAQGDGVHVRLLWQSLAPLPRDVTVFVHAYDSSGKRTPISIGDGPPMGDNFSTSLWQKGDQVLDEHVLALPAGLTLKDMQVKVGLYQPEDGMRLPAMQGTIRLPDDAATIWPR